MSGEADSVVSSVPGMRQHRNLDCKVGGTFLHSLSFPLPSSHVAAVSAKCTTRTWGKVQS